MSGFPTRTSSLKGHAGNTTRHCIAAEPCQHADRAHNNTQPPAIFSAHRTYIPTDRKAIEKYSSNGCAELLREPTCSEELHATVHTIDYKAGLDTFRFPTPSPRVSAVLPHFPPRITVATTLPSTANHQRIGMAAASPSRVPPNCGRANTTDCVPTTTRQQAPTRPPFQTTRTYRSAEPTTKQKTGSGWRSVGNFFRRPSRAPLDDAFLDLIVDTPPKPKRTAANAPDVVARHAIAKPFEPSCLSVPMHQAPTKRLQKPSATGLRGQPRLASVGEDRVAPLPAAQARKLRSPHCHGSRSTARLSPDNEEDDAAQPREHKRHDSPVDLHRLVLDDPPEAPKLDCNIPSTQFDRYSVMFSQLLLPELPKSSLLERRQSRLSRRISAGEIIGDGSIGIEFAPRSATPPPPPPPSMSIATAHRDTSSIDRAPRQRPQPKARSQTAPTGALWPLSATLVPQRPHHIVQHSLTNSPDSNLYSEPSLPPTPTTGTSCTDSDPAKSARTPTTCHTWSTNRPLLMTRDSLETRSPPYPRIKSPADLERQIVQVSVARQVSVSRARTRVQQALPSKQPLKPRVVNLSFSTNRKSEVGLFESCEDIAEVMETY